MAMWWPRPRRGAGCPTRLAFHREVECSRNRHAPAAWRHGVGSRGEVARLARWRFGYPGAHPSRMLRSPLDEVTILLPRPRPRADGDQSILLDHRGPAACCRAARWRSGLANGAASQRDTSSRIPAGWTRCADERASRRTSGRNSNPGPISRSTARFRGTSGVESWRHGRDLFGIRGGCSDCA